ncbi:MULTISPECIES: viperin family antiviral radical SAM protein [unclassified Neisseria]|uniref:viperin family antiviral radical SAM protein n=1 Tax=unclassified Neisseria TaxID=2623750 RepID=UPI002666A0F1|nr:MULTISPECIES: viperin family antiviral radical SAM protein [unclassified Neisseria]MDO1510665.1 viperin family antiviral radical SAM protein [Neisseria sp. MVDL19-042950]MDO1516955.1 viperin family antiviral radical SAM protein [Neisseria sp. MVDL18-041461]MDO1564317.1 viperin family antiviral radical SAM protein [Neisseria sp. MVDL20-010259]
MKTQTHELVVNWHITEACNYVCRYCFAKWDKQGKELLHSSENIQVLMGEISKLPEILNRKQGADFRSIRLNLVGGEPFLYRRQVMQIIKAAQAYGFSLSAITNGSLLDDELVALIARHFAVIGFSVDSLNGSTNLKIGRKSSKQAMQSDEVLANIQAIKALNPAIGIKINTVVNSLNYRENLHQFIADVQPEKWKIFKMLPMVTEDLSISDEQFHEFLNCHDDFRRIISSEDNDEMVHSYLMIDPLGRFFQNDLTLCGGYVYSRPIHECDVENALDEVLFDTGKFKTRYVPITHPLAA